MYMLIVYTSIDDVVSTRTTNISIFDDYDTAVANNKFATLNESEPDGSYKTIKLKHTKRNYNKKNKP